MSQCLIKVHEVSDCNEKAPLLETRCEDIFDDASMHSPIRLTDYDSYRLLMNVHGSGNKQTELRTQQIGLRFTVIASAVLSVMHGRSINAGTTISLACLCVCLQRTPFFPWLCRILLHALLSHPGSIPSLPDSPPP